MFPYGIRLDLFDFIKVVNKHDPVFVGFVRVRLTTSTIDAYVLYVEPYCIVLELYVHTYYTAMPESTREKRKLNSRASCITC